LFKGDIQVQGEHLMATLKIAVDGLDDLDAIVPTVEDLGRRHVDYGVKDEDYDTVGEALLWTLEKGFGDEFTPEVKGAWATVYTLLATVMTNAANASGDAASGDANPPTNDFGAPVSQDLMDEVLAAQAGGVTAATESEMNAEMEAERETEAPDVKPEPKASVPAKAESKAPAKKKEDGKAPKESSVAASSIRVHVDVLEDLMTLVSELVLTRNQLLQMVRGRDQGVMPESGV